MTNLKEIESAMAEAKPGTIIRITGYVNSTGDRRDVEVETLQPGAYLKMLELDYELLTAAEVGDLGGDGHDGDLTLTDFITAKNQLVMSRMLAMERATGGGEPDADATTSKMVSVGPYTATHPDSPAALYIHRVKALNPSVRKPAKGAIPRAKQHIAEALCLPTRDYIHSLKLEPGKFEDVTIYEPSAAVI